MATIVGMGPNDRGGIEVACLTKLSIVQNPSHQFNQQPVHSPQQLVEKRWQAPHKILWKNAQKVKRRCKISKLRTENEKRLNIITHDGDESKKLQLYGIATN